MSLKVWKRFLPKGLKRRIKHIVELFRTINDIGPYSMAIAGKNKLVTKLDMLLCMILYEASPADYYFFDFKQIPRKNRKTFLTFGKHKRLIEKNYSNKEYLAYWGKNSFLERFSAFHKREWAMANECTLEQFKQLSRAEGRIICKPNGGERGKGIEVLAVNDENAEQLFEKIRALNDYVLEEWIDQHPQLSRIYPDAVNPVRIQTICKENEVSIIGATLTCGKTKKYANASSGAYFALVDIETGEVCSDLYDYETKSVLFKHPITGAEVRGINIPFWKEATEMVKNAAMITPNVITIGWDVAISKNGPKLIEGNIAPGYTAYQMPVLTGVPYGNLRVFAPFLK